MGEADLPCGSIQTDRHRGRHLRGLRFAELMNRANNLHPLLGFQLISPKAREIRYYRLIRTRANRYKLYRAFDNRVESRSLFVARDGGSDAHHALFLGTTMAMQNCKTIGCTIEDSEHRELFQQDEHYARPPFVRFPSWGQFWVGKPMPGYEGCPYTEAANAFVRMDLEDNTYSPIGLHELKAIAGLYAGNIVSFPDSELRNVPPSSAVEVLAKAAERAARVDNSVEVFTGCLLEEAGKHRLPTPSYEGPIAYGGGPSYEETATGGCNPTGSHGSGRGGVDGKPPLPLWVQDPKWVLDFDHILFFRYGSHGAARILPAKDPIPRDLMDLVRQFLQVKFGNM